LLFQLYSGVGGENPPQLGSARRSRGPGRYQIHDSTRRHDRQRDDRKTERLYGARLSLAARGSRHAADSAAARRVPKSHADRSPSFRLSPVMLMSHRTLWTTLAATAIVALLVNGRPVAQQPQQPRDAVTSISSDQVGQQPRLAIPDFLALGASGSSAPDAETVDVAKTIAQVLTADFEF